MTGIFIETDEAATPVHEDWEVHTEKNKYIEVLAKVSEAWRQLGYRWDQIRIETEAQIQNGVPAVLGLMNLGITAEELYALVRLAQNNESFVVVEPATIDISLFGSFSIALAMSEQVCPYAVKDGRLQAVSANPFKINQQYSMLTSAFPDLEAVIHLTTPMALRTALDGAALRLSREEVSRISDRASVREEESAVADIASVRGSEEQRLAREIITGGIRARASDVHLDPVATGIEVRYRIDGLIVHNSVLPTELAMRVINHIKIESGLDPSRNLPPQDGRLAMEIDGAKTDFRIATLPTVGGMDKLTIRLSTTGNVLADLSELGFDVELLQRYQRILNLSAGLVLVTGPVGAGKTHTLYSSIKYLDSGSLEILTLEDPVEAIINGITQVAIRPQVTFQTLLRHVVRQDPNVVVIGEIRDPVTSAMATEAAITGRLVLSTLHTTDAISAVQRLRDLGVERYQISAGLKGVLAQRLLRLLCDCKTEDILRDQTEGLPWPGGEAPRTIFRPAGCPLCGGTGYRGRLAVGELLVVDDDISEAISQGGTGRALKRLAIDRGMETMVQNALKSVTLGRTSLSEVRRVLGTEFRADESSQSARARLISGDSA